jgi:hypothetical protein
MRAAPLEAATSSADGLPIAVVPVEFSGEIWFWNGPSPFHLVTVPEDLCDALDAAAGMVSHGWGMIPVKVSIGDTDPTHEKGAPASGRSALLSWVQLSPPGPATPSRHERHELADLGDLGQHQIIDHPELIDPRVSEGLLPS